MYVFHVTHIICIYLYVLLWAGGLKHMNKLDLIDLVEWKFRYPLAMQSFHTTGMFHMYLIIVKYPLVQISVQKLPLLTFDQLFMPSFH